MSPEADAGRVEVAACGNVIYARAVGKCLQKQGIAFYEFASAMRKAGCREIILDLSECSGMDSTFMGAVMSVKTIFDDADGLKIVNMCQACEKHFRGIGVLGLLDLAPGPVAFPPVRLIRLGDPAYGELGRMDVILKVHKRLVELNSDLQAQFGECIRAIEDELRERRKADDGKGKT